jgi:hypothetical protein
MKVLYAILAAPVNYSLTKEFANPALLIVKLVQVLPAALNVPRNTYYTIPLVF